MNNILIVEDEHLIARLIEMTLTRAGYRCTLAEDGRTAADLIETTNFDMALLDIMLPGLDGYALLECLRPQGVPVIFITAKSAVKDRVQGLRLGADDYIVKPFSPREIVSRIRVIFRRINSLETAQEKNELQIGNTRINLSRYEVCVDGEKVVFSPKEVEILHLMAAHLNQVFTREQLLDSIWGFDFDGDSRVVDTSIKRIRKKLPEYSMLAVRSVYGVGYKIEAANA